MKPEEISTNKYLKNLYGGNVVFEPDGNIPPNFLVNSVYAVEVRRLNQQFFEDDHAVGLEKLSYPLADAIKEVLASYDSQYSGKSYWVNIYYKRPLDRNIRQVKSEMQIALNDFLQSDLILPCTIRVNEKIELYIDSSDLVSEQVFRIAIEGDDDAGGGVISTYIQNIRHCIVDKSSKINWCKSRYKNWWLYLVDYMELGLDYGDIERVKSAILDLGEFNRVAIINYSGEFLLFDISTK
jgi:hypothetical protein